ncbi:MAG: phosphoglycerate kinase [Halobacteriaceae archaeon]
MGVPTLDDLVATDRVVATRIDVNSPLTETNALADDSRLHAHRDTLAELVADDARVAVLAHQGRPGGEDFAPLEPHAARLDDLLEAPVDYCDAVCSSDARRAINALDSGEVVVLENTRFYSEEYMEFSPDRAASTYLVTRLAPECDAYVNDAFAAAHRSQPSLVGFPSRLPGYAGRVLEHELDVLGDIESTPTPRVYVLGGAKVADSIDVAAHVLEAGLADAVLTTGVLANVFLDAGGVDLGPATETYLEDNVDEADRHTAADLLDRYGGTIELPVDVAVARDDARLELPVSALPPRPDEPIQDVGADTVDAYATILEDAGTAILNGPAGVVEDGRFTRGTRELFGAATTAEYSIVGGGDTSAAITRFGIEGFDHVSTGGGAALRLLSGGTLPAVEALQ